VGGEGLEVLFRRRSIGRLTEPAPSDDELETMLRAAAAAPDHGELRPWRFVVLRGGAKTAFGEVLAQAYLGRVEKAGGKPEPAKLEKERTKLGRAPLVVIVCAVHVHDDKIPWSDQVGAANAAAQNLLLAATALGYGSMWRTGDPVYDPFVKQAVGLTEHDEIVGFVYLGTPHEGGEKPPKHPSLEGLVVEWRPPPAAILPARTFHCDECGFSAAELSEAELVTRCASFGRRFRAPLTRFLPGEDATAVLNRRPAPDVWSALEYACHVRDVFAFYRERVSRVLTEDRPVLHAVGFGSRPEEASYAGSDPVAVAVADELAREAEGLAALLEGLDEAGWQRVGLSSDGTGAERSVRVLAERAVHDAHHHLLDVGRSLRAARSG
jgi:nitroreductase